MKLVFEKQVLHYFLLAVILVVVIGLSRVAGVLSGQFLGVGTSVWFYLAIAGAILHQIYVWFCWRTQLHYSLITRLFKHRGFFYYSLFFYIFLFLRLVLVIALAISNEGSLPGSQMLLNGIAIVLAVPTLYLAYSVARYFGLKRAAGVDHFDPSYRREPLVRQGIFRFTGNGMYIFGLLVLWLPGLLWASSAALLAALFNHLYIWAHYYGTEKPDMKRIYG